MNMHTCYLIVLLLIFWFQSICGNQNAVLDKNYSDRLTEPDNQQSSLQQINSASYHATVSVKATEPSIKSQTPHHISNVNCLKRIFYFLFVLFSFLNAKFYIKIVWSELNLLNQRMVEQSNFILFLALFLFVYAYIKLDTFSNTHNI